VSRGFEPALVTIVPAGSTLIAMFIVGVVGIATTS